MSIEAGISQDHGIE